MNSKRAFKNGKKYAIDAIIVSRERHKVHRDRLNATSNDEHQKLKHLEKQLTKSKVENLAGMVQCSDESDGKISVDIHDDKLVKNGRSVTGDFENIGHMSLHTMKGEHPILDKDREGRMKSTGYGENNEFIKNATGKDLNQVVNKKYEKDLKKLGLTEIVQMLEQELITESEVSDDLKAIYGDHFKNESAEEFSFGDNPELQRIPHVINNVKDIVYGFISKKDGSRIIDRDWIHNSDDLKNYYETNWDPKITLRNKLGICLDQSLAIQHLFKKHYPEMKCDIYALYKGRFGHAVPCFLDDGKWFYLENAWDKERGLHGPFYSRQELEKYLNGIYHKHHDKDNDDPVYVMVYKRPKNTITESTIFRN